MLEHEFTFREKLLLIACLVVGFGILYYQFGYKTFQKTLDSLKTDELETEVMIYQTQAMNYQRMQAYIEEHKGEVYGEVMVYNNLANEVSELGAIFANAGDINISWTEPTLTGTTVRRDARISFKTNGYNSVKDLINKIHNCKYRCLIKDVLISTSEDTGLNETNSINVTMTVTFFETSNGAASLQGLTILDEAEPESGSE